MLQMVNIPIVASSLSADLVTQAITQKVIDRLQMDYPYVATADIRVTIRNSDLFKAIPDSATDVRLELKPDAAILDRMILDLTLLDSENQKIEQRRVFLSVEANTDYVCAAKLIPRRKVIQDQDLGTVHASIYGKPKSVFRNKKSIIGLESVTIIPKGTLLINQMIRRIPVVQKGDVVLLRYQGEDGVVIRFEGKALADGGIGDIIKVRGTHFNKELEGEVLDSKNVKIRHSGY